MTSHEVNFDGLVGPTHNYAGLSFGNVASYNNQAQPSNPKQAALEGLRKMKSMFELGLIQGIIPPQERPDIQTLRRLGFSGSDIQVLYKASKHDPELLASCCSASSMWAANAATVSPSADTADGRVHITPANLVSKFHRSIEYKMTARILKNIFTNDRYFMHHPELPCTSQFADESAANHTRFCSHYSSRGVGFFVFGSNSFNSTKNNLGPQKFPARQMLEASSAIARQHQLDDSKVVYAQQNPEVIDSGGFHNDVIAVGNNNILFCHEKAFVNQSEVYQQLKTACDEIKLSIIEVADTEVSLSDAVSSYMFNSQLVSKDNKQILISPVECANNVNVARFLTKIIDADNPISEVRYFDLRQSMRNGGGPACLRLRVVMTEKEIASITQSCLFSHNLFNQLTVWINKYYRDRLTQNDLADPSLLDYSRMALDDLTAILGLGSIYSFQV